MLVYWLNILLVGIYSFIYNLWFKENSHVKFFFIMLTVVQFVALLTLRDIFLGADMQNYWLYYDEQMNWTLAALSDERFEIGFKVLTKVITLFTENPQIYLLMIACLSTIPVGVLVYKYSKMPFLSLLLYVLLGFYSFTFSGLRQSIALGLIFIAYIFIVNSKPGKFILTVLLASTFHFSALAFLPAYLIKGYRLTKNRLVVIIVLASFILLFNSQILTWITGFFYQDFAVASTDSYTWMLMTIAIFIATLCVYNKAIAADNKNVSLYAIVLIGVLLMLFSPVADNVMRIANYYFIFIILLIPSALSVIKNPKIRAIGGVVVIGILIGVYAYLMNVNGYKINPYIFFGIN